MRDERPIAVLILYTHPLLGEGLAGMLAAEQDVTVTAVPLSDIGRTECALAAAPAVVIFERGDPDRAVEILERVPDALIIDVGIGPGPSFAYHRDEISALPDAIIEAIRSSSTRHPAGVPAPPITRPRIIARP